jgi:hypothetical protein
VVIAVVKGTKIIGGDLNNMRCEARRLFRNKKFEYLKHNVQDLATNSKNKNITDCIEE